MKKFTADFETVTWLENETWVWAWAVCEIGNEENFITGNSIESFFEFCENEKNACFYFHNLKFDGEFIIYYLLKNEFKHVEQIKDTENKTFTTLISDMGQFYNIAVYFKRNKKHVIKATFIDSLKIIPFSVEETAKTFNLPISKLTLDYNKPREKNHILTYDEIEYIHNDVAIMAKALKVIFDDNLTKMTRASNALKDYKDIISESKFKHYFPSLDFEVDKDLRKAYKRGFYLFKPYIQRNRCWKWCCFRCQFSLSFRYV